MVHNPDLPDDAALIGANCGSLSGGADACCVSHIKDNDRSCDNTNEGPCVMDYVPDYGERGFERMKWMHLA